VGTSDLNGFVEVQMKPYHPKWTRRVELPDDSVRDAADQFERGRQVLLEGLVPGCGILLPYLNTSAVAIELYLKSLASELVYTADDSLDGLYRVHSRASSPSHGLVALFDAAPDDVRAGLEHAFQSDPEHPLTPTFRDLLQQMEGLFVASRYSFERDQRVDKYRLQHVGWLSAFLSHYVAEFPTREWIEWGPRPRSTGSGAKE
jgi:hypothetical protein